MDVYSFSMIAYQLFELTPPFSGMDPVDAARKAALAEERPPLMRLATQMPTMRVCCFLQGLSSDLCMLCYTPIDRPLGQCHSISLALSESSPIVM